MASSSIWMWLMASLTAMYAEEAVISPWRLDAQELAVVIPPWLDAFGAPRVHVALSFKGTSVCAGQLLPENLTASRPHVSLLVPPSLANSSLTFTMVDPDAPAPDAPILSDILHWIVSNISPAHNSDQEIWESGVESASYIAPSPVSGTHRYYVLVFEQSGEIQVEDIENRTNFSMREFTKKYNLYYPVGGTFFRVSADT